MRKRKFGPMRFTLGILMSFLLPAAHAEVVNVWGDTGRVTTVNTFYDGLTGHSSTVISGDLDSNDLTGVDLLWIVQPQTPLTTAENATLSDFLAVGGRIAFMGEHCTFSESGNANINLSLAAVGSSIQIENPCTTQDGGFHVASRVNGQILDHTLTESVNTYRYAAFAPLVMGPGAETLMLGTDLASIMMGFENIGPGSVFLITDQNPFDDPYAEDNEVMFENLLTGITGAPPVEPPTPAGPAKPVPTVSQWTLVGLGVLLALLGYAGLRRRV